jgi:hypothetical protein
MYSCKTFANIPGQENTVLVGAEDKNITQIKLEKDSYEIIKTF